MKENNEDFNQDEIPERELFVHHVSYKDETYTFGISGCIMTVDGNEDVRSLDIVLHPKEVSEIRDYFFLRGKLWEPSVAEKFQQHSPELYEKIYAAVQSLWERSEEYESEQEDLMVYGEDADFERIELSPLWPKKLFDEMDIHIPNISIWVSNVSIEEENGMGYPIYLEPEYYIELKEILEKVVWGKKSLYDLIDINNLTDKHKGLCDTIKARMKEMLIFTYDFEESWIEDLNFSIWYYSILDDCNS